MPIIWLLANDEVDLYTNQTTFGWPDCGEITLNIHALTAVVAEGEGSDFLPKEIHIPTIAEFFPPAIFGNGLFFEFNRVQLVRLIAIVALLLFFIIVANRAKLVPSRAQSVAELAIEFVQKQIVFEVIGKEQGKKYVPMITTLFLGILAMNITGVVVGLNLAGTAAVGIPLLFAIWVYVTYLGAGIKEHGLGGFLKTNLFPAGVPKPMYLLITPIEILQVFLIRPASLALRLLANMLAGHMIIVVFISMTQWLIFSVLFNLADTGTNPAVGLVGFLTMAAAFGLTLFEVLVAFLQAYIFSLLASVYIQLSTSHEH